LTLLAAKAAQHTASKQRFVTVTYDKGSGIVGLRPGVRGWQ